MKLKKYDKIEIDWTDSCTHVTRWTDEKKYDYEKDDKFTRTGKSTGYYLKSTKSNIFFCQRLFGLEKDRDVGGVDSIPRGCILKIKKVK